MSTNEPAARLFPEAEPAKCIGDFGFGNHGPAKYEVQFDDPDRNRRYGTRVCEECAATWRGVRDLHLIQSLPRPVCVHTEGTEHQ